MVEKLEIKIEVIAHATEDVKKILNSIFEFFKIEEDEFKIQNLSGHFENPITLMTAKISKKKAKGFLDNFKSEISHDQIEEISDNIENYIQNSTLYLRIGKQDLIRGSIHLQERDAIKLKIFSPSYNKKKVVQNYLQLLKYSN